MARWPEFLPDGEHVLFQVRHADLDRRGIYVASVAGNGSRLRRLLGSDWAAHFGSGHLLFLDGSTLMAQLFDVAKLGLHGTPMAVVRGVGGSSTAYGSFSVSTTGVLAYTGALSIQSELRWVDRSGRTGELVSPEGDYVDFRLSPDQSRVAYARVDPQMQAPDVWILDLTRVTSTRITSERLVDAGPIWSPNGEQIVFRSNRSSTIGVELYVTSSSPGGTTRRIYGSRMRDRTSPAMRWRRTGQAMGRCCSSRRRWRRAMGSGPVRLRRRIPKPILDTQYNEVQAAVSPDERWMAYARSIGALRDLCSGLSRGRAANAGFDQWWNAATVARRWTGAVLHSGGRLAHAGGVTAEERLTPLRQERFSTPDSLYAQSLSDGLRPFG